jgi:hypothetical protein
MWGLRVLEKLDVCVWGWRDFSLFVILLGWWILPWCFGGVMGGFCAF